MTAVWLASLPQCFMRGTYQSGFIDTSLRSDVDQAPGKSRNRFSIGIYPIGGVMNMTAAQLADFKDFHKDDLARGVLPFTFPDQEKDGDLLVQFKSMPDVAELIRKRVYAVTLSLEVLP